MKTQTRLLASVFSLLCLSGSLRAAEKRGAELVITKTGGQEVKGELIAVKTTSLLLLDSSTAADTSVEIQEISVVKIAKKSRALTVGAAGFGVGAVLGILYAGVIDRLDEVETSSGVYLAVPLIFGAIGAIPGALVGAYLGKDRVIPFAGKTDAEIKEILEKLRRQARVANAQ
jgi:hypothetical protein